MRPGLDARDSYGGSPWWPPVVALGLADSAGPAIRVAHFMARFVQVSDKFAIPEARFRRRTLLGFSVNRVNGCCAVAKKRAGSSCSVYELREC